MHTQEFSAAWSSLSSFLLASMLLLRFVYRGSRTSNVSLQEEIREIIAAGFGVRECSWRRLSNAGDGERVRQGEDRDMEMGFGDGLRDLRLGFGSVGFGIL